MTTHSSILAWEIPRTEEPGGPQSMGPQRVGHDLASKRGHMLSMSALYLYYMEYATIRRG